MCKWNKPTFPCPREVVQMGNQCGIDLDEKKAKSRVGTFPIDLGEKKAKSRVGTFPIDLCEKKSKK